MLQWWLNPCLTGSNFRQPNNRSDFFKFVTELSEGFLMIFDHCELVKIILLGMMITSDTESVSQIKSCRRIINQMEQVVKNQTWRIQIIWKTNEAEQQNFVAPYSGAHAQLTPVIMRMCVKYHHAGAKNIKICKKENPRRRKNRRKPTKINSICWAAQQLCLVTLGAQANTIQKFLSYHSTILLPFCGSW